MENRQLNKQEKVVVLSVNDATFEFEFKRERENSDSQLLDNVEDFKLCTVNFQVKKGELVCIEGTVGSGKTSLLSAILADLSRSEGSIAIQDVNTGFGYVSQSVWLQRGTIRENILWGNTYDDQLYQKTLFSCCLTEDLTQLGGDMAFVGEGGQTLSGGQKMRVALARAVYQNKSIYLLDDVLSCLDAHVANHIIQHCLLGMLSSKTRIIVTENRKLLNVADQVFQMANGQLTAKECTGDESEFSEDGDEYVTHNEKPKSSKKQDNSSSKNCSFQDHMASHHEEVRQVGHLKSGTVFEYWKAMSGKVSTLVLVSILLMQMSRNASDLWLANWVGSINPSNLTGNGTQDQNIGYYLGIYSGLVLSNSVLTLARSFLFAYAGIKAAKILHKKLCNKVFGVSLCMRMLNNWRQ